MLFKPRSDEYDYKGEFEITLSKKMTYDMVRDRDARLRAVSC